jgi:hypothetical protein
MSCSLLPNRRAGGWGQKARDPAPEVAGSSAGELTWTTAVEVNNDEIESNSSYAAGNGSDVSRRM